MYLKMKEMCKKEKFNSEIFDSRVVPPKWCSKWWKKIRESYIKMLSSFIGEKPFFIFENNKNSKKYSEKNKEKTAKDIEICFEGILKEFLRDIKRKYKKNIWRIKNRLENIKKAKNKEIKKESKTSVGGLKKCFR